MIFLQNAVGFFIQLFPCTLIAFLPFPQEVCRVRRKWIFACTAIVTAIDAVLFAALINSCDASNTTLAADLFMLLSILLILTAYNRMVRETLIKKLLVFFMVMFYATLQFCLVNAFNSVIAAFSYVKTVNSEFEIYYLSDIVMYLVTDLLLLPFMMTFVIRVIREYIREVEPQNMRREFSVLIVSTIIFISMMVCVDITYYSPDFKTYLLILALFLVLLLYQVLVYWLICRESVQRRHENERRRTEEIHRMQYEKIAGDIENTRRMRHDLRHHYNSLYDMLDRGRFDEMKEYLSEVIDTTVKRENEIYCKNMTINGLLQYYIGLARDENISCEVQAECGELTIESADLTVLFGNAMENAINACRKYSGKRFISVIIGTVQDSLAIEISNSCGGVRLNRRFQADDGFSPAEAFLSDSKDGGYGLRSIAHTAQKYDGSAKFRFNAETETFTVRIRLNMHTENLKAAKAGY